MLYEESFLKFVNKLNSFIDLPVIVEGLKDKEVLSKLGFKKIFPISGNSLIKIADKISKNYNEVIILTDFDFEGRNKFKFFKKYFEANHIKINTLIPKLIKSLFKISKIEELSHFTKFIEGDYNGQACSINYKIFNRSRVYSRWRCRKT